eukprot:Em0022g904a
MSQPSANDEQMECEGTEAIAVQVKAYSRPLVSPDAYSVKTEYETTKEALEKRFEPESKRTLYFVEFQAKGRKKEETWSDFANELRVLADKALPDVEDKAKQLSVFSRQPKTLDDAVACTLETESYLLRGAKDIRVAAVTPLIPSPESASLAAVR